MLYKYKLYIQRWFRCNNALLASCLNCRTLLHVHTRICICGALCEPCAALAEHLSPVQPPNTPPQYTQNTKAMDEHSMMCTLSFPRPCQMTKTLFLAAPSYCTLDHGSERTVHRRAATLLAVAVISGLAGVLAPALWPSPGTLLPATTATAPSSVKAGHLPSPVKRRSPRNTFAAPQRPFSDAFPLPGAAAESSRPLRGSVVWGLASGWAAVCAVSGACLWALQRLTAGKGTALCLGQLPADPDAAQAMWAIAGVPRAGSPTPSPSPLMPP